ncbi:MAG: type II secretion system protein [Oscillospiraceae bacterium]|nr:type II secretion system protein [Oscillospiraceae bacterium]
MKKKNKLRGFSLVEVMTSLVIMVILIAIASGVIITTFNIFGRNALFRAAQNNGNNVYNFIYDHLSYATALKIDETVDINTKNGLSFIDEDDLKITGTEGSETVEIIPYYERINITKDSMSLTRKSISTPVNILGGNTVMNGCSCIVSFEQYPITDPTDNSKTIKPDTISFKVEIVRDGEVFYSRQGNIPILNKSAKDHIIITDNISTENNNKINMLYTYIN